MGSQGDKELRSFQINLKYIIKISTVKAAQLLPCYCIKRFIFLVLESGYEEYNY